MKPCYCCICILFNSLLSTGFTCVADATEIQQWRDPDGQLHYGDQAPSGTAITRTLRLHDEATVSTRGLRPAEQQAIERFNRSKQQQRKKAISAQRTQQRKQAQTHKQCQQARDNFRNARKDEDFNQYALYLRRHCW